MDRRDVLLGVSVLGLAAAAPPGVPRARKVLLVDLDDIGRDILSRAIALGGAPQIAQAMAQGRTWETFWAAPNCSLFRARALTGANAYRPESYVGRLVQTSDQFPGPAGMWLPEGLPGTRTKLGKWHLSGDVPAAMFPQNLITQGWTRFVGNHSNLFTNGTGYYDWREYDADASGVVSTQQTQHHTTRMAALALSEIAAGTDLIHASFCAIHKPLELPPDNEPAGKIYQGVTDFQIRLDLLYHLDYWLGVVMTVAVQQGYVVVVACDNGTDQIGKNTYTEAGNNTPLFAIGTGVVPGISTRLIAATDLWTTVRRMRGGSGTAPDSVDFCDDLLGWPPVAAERQFLTLDWYPGLAVPPVAAEWSRMIRDARWKLVKQKIKPAGTVPTFGDNVTALFDLVADPSEQTNLLDNPLTPEAQAAYDLLLANLPT